MIDGNEERKFLIKGMPEHVIDGNEERKLLLKGMPEHVIEKIYQDIGESSMCWEHIDRAGSFRAEMASRIAFDLCLFLIDEMQEYKKASGEKMLIV